MNTSESTIYAFDELLTTQLSILGFDFFEFKSLKFYIKAQFYSLSVDAFIERYASEGESVFQDVDGDYLIIIVAPNKVSVVRDRHGAGSQFFYSNKYFAFNLLSFSQSNNFDTKPNVEALLTFMSIGYIPSPETALQTVKKLASGEMLIFQNAKIEVTDLFGYEQYMKNAGVAKMSIEEATASYEKLHKKAISQRIEGKTKVGLLLSGGYDSGGNISALREVYKGDVVSFTIGFKDNPWTELPLAKILAQKYGSRHYEYEIDGSEIMQLPQILLATGDPFQEGGLMVNFTAMRLVQESGEMPDIILGGDGNDQHFGTSGKELALNWKLRKKGLSGLQHVYYNIGQSLNVFQKDNILFRTQFHNSKILHIQESDVFGFSLNTLNKINKNGIKMKQYKYLSAMPKTYKSFDEYFYNRNYNIDIKQVIDEVILFKSSRMSELFSNHISFPYMSTELYHFLNQMPVNYKFKGSFDDLAAGKGMSKFLHKNYLKPKLPSEITDRKKQGGFAPLPIFLKNNEQRAKLFSFIKKSDAITTLFKEKYIVNLLSQYDDIVSSSPYWFWYQQVKANQIINLLTLAVWWEMYINQKYDVRSIEELL
jgi:asparagine synthase (glutamine-hydrolysing)